MLPLFQKCRNCLISQIFVLSVNTSAQNSFGSQSIHCPGRKNGHHEKFATSVCVVASCPRIIAFINPVLFGEPLTDHSRSDQLIAIIPCAKLSGRHAPLRDVKDNIKTLSALVQRTRSERLTIPYPCHVFARRSGCQPEIRPDPMFIGSRNK